MKIGFIGLGIMGSRMAGHLIDADYDLIIHNRSKDKATELIEKGATWADTPASVAEQSDILITMLAHPQAVESVALGENGFLDAMPENTLWVDCSTVNPSFTRRMADKATSRNIRFMDAPVAGSKVQVTNKQLVAIAGGDASDLEICKPLFEQFSQRVVHAGEHGMGSSLKLVVNMMLGISMVAFSEGVAFGKSMGISEEVLHNVLIGGPVVAPFIGLKRDKIEQGEYSPEFPLQWMHKDLHLASVTAYENDANVVLSSMAKELFGMALRAGHGEDDLSAIYAFLNQSKSD